MVLTEDVSRQDKQRMAKLRAHQVMFHSRGVHVLRVTCCCLNRFAPLVREVRVLDFGNLLQKSSGLLAHAEQWSRSLPS